MQQWHVPGAVVVLVKNDAIVLQKGYGFADLEKQAPMSPATTILRVFSLSKLFTATAIMQVVEQGRIDVDVDVTTYLRQTRLQQTDLGPITIRHLLTYTAGFDSDQRAIGGSASSSTDWLSLDVIWQDAGWLHCGARQGIPVQQCCVRRSRPGGGERLR
jgi:CubicO group peptidase (beta-lactamase class C family)